METDLVIVPAGAGAGKTHRIKTQRSEWIAAGVVRPERILAVTFTEAAASELRERIRSGLLAEGLVSEALAVERAYVSTIHGLGLRLLTEHALAAGGSPQPRHLGDAERGLLMAAAGTGSWRGFPPASRPMRPTCAAMAGPAPGRARARWRNWPAIWRHSWKRSAGRRSVWAFRWAG